jgi:hypothetical protein
VGVCGVVSVGSGYGPVSGSCEGGYEHSGSVAAGLVVGQLDVACSRCQYVPQCLCVQTCAIHVSPLRKSPVTPPFASIGRSSCAFNYTGLRNYIFFLRQEV